MIKGNHLRERYFEHLLKRPTDIDELRDIKLQILQESPNPQYLYKYCSIYTALKILDSGYIQLQPPDNFNDPFDCLSNVGVWNQGSLFSPNKDELTYLDSLMKKLPSKFQLPFRFVNDLRTSYYYVISCFTTDHINTLMWSHYSDNHGAVCMEFDIMDILDHLHPCYYVDKMPLLNWQSKNINLALIKANAWNYEREWRYITETIRPEMRIFGSASHDIYNTIHSLENFNQNDYEKWDQALKSILEDLEHIYNEQRKLKVRPTKIFLGLDFRKNYANVNSEAIVKQIEKNSKEHNIALHRIHARHNTFVLYDSVLQDIRQLFNPFLD